MPIISTNFNDVGNVGQVPSLIRIDTNDSLATVLTTGYLNILKDQNLPLTEDAIVFVSTGVGVHKTVTVLSMTYSNGDWSLQTIEGYEPTGGGQGISFVGLPGTSKTAVINMGYVIENALQTTVTLPAVAPLGAVVAIQGSGAAGWVLAPGSGQTIKVGQSSASTSITSSGNYDAIQVVCVVANTTWTTSYLVSSGVTIS